MTNDRAQVRRVLDKARSEGRTSLTAPEGKLVCDAYGIPVPKEGVATSAEKRPRWRRRSVFPWC
jgi:acyl-CoA synthetase (NDP forming)